MTRGKWQRIGIGVVLAFALGAVLYFGGRWQERSFAAGEHAQLIEQVEAAQMERARAQAQLALAEDRIRLLWARSLLFETAVDLDRRNFGTANQHLDAAADQLKAVREGGPRMDTERLQALQRSVEETNLNVATDLEVQRAQVLEFLDRLDALIAGEQSAAATSVRSQPETSDTPTGGS